MITKKNSQSGFSLVELMVVVAIIGILATVAIPRVNRYMAKSRQSEAEVNLGSIYTANKAFFVEFTSYGNEFGMIGYSPEGNIRYNIGWTAAALVPANYSASHTTLPSGMNALTNTAAFCPASTKQCVMMTGADGTTIGGTIPTTNSVSATNFIAGAAALLTSSSASKTQDTWTINDTKQLVNVTDGTIN